MPRRRPPHPGFLTEGWGFESLAAHHLQLGPQVTRHSNQGTAGHMPGRSSFVAPRKLTYAANANSRAFPSALATSATRAGNRSV